MGIYTRRRQDEQAANYRDWLNSADVPGVVDGKKFRVASNQALAAHFNTVVQQITSAILNRITTEPQAVFASLYYSILSRIGNLLYPGDAGDFTAQGLADNGVSWGGVCIVYSHGANNLGFEVSCV